MVRRRATGTVDKALTNQNIQHEKDNDKRTYQLWLAKLRLFLLDIRKILVIGRKDPKNWLPLALVSLGLVLMFYALTSHFMTTTQPVSTLRSRELPPLRGSFISRSSLSMRPRVVGFYFNSPSSSSYLGTERMDPNLHRLRNEPFAVEVESTFKAMQEHLKDSDDYEIRLSEKFETGHCKAMYKWQTQSFPNCNSVFEQDLTQLRKEQVRLIANGYWRDVWRVQAANDTVALKTLRYVHKISARNFDRHRRDALAMDQLTSSRWIVDIHSYCGNTAIVEYAPGGSLDDSIFSSSEQDYWEPHERLIIAYQVASGVAAVHNTPAEGRAAIAHTDIDTLQFVHITSTGMYKLNDFNRCRFLRWNNDTQQPCGFTVGNNPGTYRSPEEYAYQVQTEKGDVYSMGNVFYSILTRKWPFKDQRNEASSIVKRGGRPPIDEAIRNSTNPFDQAILHAIDLCWVQDPSSRTSARNVQRYFEKRLQELGVKKG